MKQQAERAAGLDVHRDNVVAATRINEPGGEVTVTKKRFPTTRRGIGELAAFLTDAAVTRVAMEATGVYWKAPYYALEGLFDELWLCNAQHVKNVPGRKSDLGDAEWLADVAAHGMVRPSFVLGGRAMEVVYDDEGLKTYFNRALWLPLNFNFIGENKRGDHVRVHYFPGARVPLSW